MSPTRRRSSSARAGRSQLAFYGEACRCLGDDSGPRHLPQRPSHDLPLTIQGHDILRNMDDVIAKRKNERADLELVSKNGAVDVEASCPADADPALSDSRGRTPLRPESRSAQSRTNRDILDGIGGDHTAIATHINFVALEPGEPYAQGDTSPIGNAHGNPLTWKAPIYRGILRPQIHWRAATPRATPGRPLQAPRGFRLVEVRRRERVRDAAACRPALHLRRRQGPLNP